MPDRVYLDWNATAPLRPEARQAMTAAFDLVGNPSSVHTEGRRARQMLEQARNLVAKAVGAAAENVVFTSGGTEANGLALASALAGSGGPLQRLIVSAIEHPSVLSAVSSGATTVPVNRSGVLDLDALGDALGHGPPALVSVMAANNETGAIQPVREAAEMVHQAGGLLHVDAVQTFGKIPLDINDLSADLVSLSAHKIGGPKGVGALVLGDAARALGPLIRGGGQERGRRAGTENLAGIAGFGAAVTPAMADIDRTRRTVGALREQLERGLQELGPVTVFSAEAERLYNTILFTAPGLKAETAVIGFDLEGVAVSSGSACSSGKVQPSHVLQAMGFGPEEAQGAVRISLGWASTGADVERCLQAWRKLHGTLVKKSDETRIERF